MNSWVCQHLDDLPEVVSQFLKKCNGKKIAFYGQMGAGKTTFIKELCKQLGADDLVNSPTFTIINEYQGKNKINHFDCYRLNKEEELFDLGYEEYFFGDEYVFIEWPEKIEHLIPDFFIKVSIEINERDERCITCVN